MGVVYSLYDALVSIHVPDEKAKAVIDALEREMMDKLATKADLASLQAITKADIANLQATTSTELAHMKAVLSGNIERVEERVTASMRTGFAELETRLTVRLGGLMVGITAVSVALLGVIQYFS